MKHNLSLLCLKIRFNIIKTQYQSTLPCLQLIGASQHGYPPAHPAEVCPEQASCSEEGRPSSHHQDPTETPRWAGELVSVPGELVQCRPSYPQYLHYARWGTGFPDSQPCIQCVHSAYTETVYMVNLDISVQMSVWTDDWQPRWLSLNSSQLLMVSNMSTCAFLYNNKEIKMTKWNTT